MSRQTSNHSLPAPLNAGSLSRRQVVSLLGAAWVAAPLAMSAGNVLGQIAGGGESGPQATAARPENHQPHNTMPNDAHCAYHFLCTP